MTKNDIRFWMRGAGDEWYIETIKRGKKYRVHWRGSMRCSSFSISEHVRASLCHYYDVTFAPNFRENWCDVSARGVSA